MDLRIRKTAANTAAAAILALLALLTIVGVGGCAGRQAGPVLLEQPMDPEQYRLGIGDTITIRVYGGEEDLTFPRIRLNDRSTLALPFGDYVAYGKTTRELEAAITESIRGKLLLKPRVWVNVEEYRPYFTQGQVTRPGAYPYQPGMTVRRAINIAGGFRERAAQDKIFVIRENDKNNTPVRININSAVRPGDTIIVEESFF